MTARSFASGHVPWPDPRAAAPAAARGGKSLPETNPAKLPFLWGLWVYRNVVSPLDGSRCGLYPTCSAYATEAIRLHGPLFGGMLAADRLLHEGSVRPPEYPIVERFGRKWIADPVAANDAIFRRGKSAAVRLTPPRAPVIPGLAYEKITELRRAAFLAGDAARASSLLADAGWVAAEAGAATRNAAGEKGRTLGLAAGPFEDADRLFEDAERAAMEAKDEALRLRAGYGRAFAFLARGYGYEARRRFVEIAKAETPAEPVIARDAAWLAAWARLSSELGDGESARTAVKAFEPFAGDPERGADATALLADVKAHRFRPRSPQVAAALSLALPGLGYVYAGKPLVGGGAFLLNAAFIAGIVYSIQDGNYPLAAILLGLESGWYLGGSGGAAQAVLTTNDARRHAFESSLQRRFMGTVWPGGAAARISF